MGLSPVLRGPLANHPIAADFAGEVGRVHLRYATEVVAAHSLCPFLRDPAAGFGAFCVVMGETLDVELVAEFAAEAKGGVAHIVYPLCLPPPRDFERFSGDIGRRLKEVIPNPPVMAAFHPGLTGDPGSPHRLVGLLRRAPDPFIQLVPEGLHQGGTVFAGSGHVPQDPAQNNFDRLKGEGLPRLFAILEDVRSDRDRAYAPYLAALRG